MINERGYYRGGGFSTVVFIISVLLGLYLLNSSFLWIKIPEQVALLNNLIDAIAGAVLIFLGIAYSLSRKFAYPRY